MGVRTVRGYSPIIEAHLENDKFHLIAYKDGSMELIHGEGVYSQVIFKFNRNDIINWSMEVREMLFNTDLSE